MVSDLAKNIYFAIQEKQNVENRSIEIIYVFFIYTYIYVFPFYISPCKQSQFDFFSSFHPLNLNLTFSIDHAKRQSGGHSCQLPMHALLWDEDERGFLGWAMGAPHGTAKPQPAGLPLPPPQ